MPGRLGPSGSPRGLLVSCFAEPPPQRALGGPTLYDFNNFFLGPLGTPFYTSSTDIHDIAVDAGGLSLYGQACAGAKGLPRWGFGGYPFQGNTAHQNGPSGAQFHLVIGPIGIKQSLAPIGAINCFLNLVILIDLRGNLDTAGRVKVPAPVPVQASLLGATAYAQFGILDSTANAIGLIRLAFRQDAEFRSPQATRESCRLSPSIHPCPT